MLEPINLNDGKALFWFMVTVYGWLAGLYFWPVATLFILVGSLWQRKLLKSW